MLVHRYDIVPVSGEWSEHTQWTNHLIAAILPPDQDVEVEMAPRKGREEVWRLSMGDASAVSFPGAEL